MDLVKDMVISLSIHSRTICKQTAKGLPISFRSSITRSLKCSTFPGAYNASDHPYLQNMYKSFPGNIRLLYDLIDRSRRIGHTGKFVGRRF